jgi:methylthioribose-1-phosphate isomerase
MRGLAEPAHASNSVFKQGIDLSTSLQTSLQTVSWVDGKLRLIDQTLLPHKLQYVDYEDWRSAADAITTMVVRGAPAIGCTAALGMALGARSIETDDWNVFRSEMEKIARLTKAARPTAVNLAWAVDRIMRVIDRFEGSVEQAKWAAEDEAVGMLDEDLTVNRTLGRHGAELVPDNGTVLTHCNAGALACVGFGTALGVVRAAVEAGKSVRVIADETRPRLQGMKLTAWELMQEGIPVTVIADNMAAVLMREGKIDCVVVGADRIAANGDTANKIGTYNVAVLAKHHGIPFYVAAPFSTIDMSLPDGSGIPIEERDLQEVTHMDGVRIAPEDAPVWNPAFDVTPNALITAIITEKGVVRAPFDENLTRLYSSTKDMKNRKGS